MLLVLFRISLTHLTWKFNNSLCDDVDYCRELNELVPAWINLYTDVEDERILWELMKFEVRKFSQTFAKKKAVNKSRYLKSLEDKVKDIEFKLSNNSSEENKKAWNEAKEELENEYNNITQGIIIRSRAEWVEKSEKAISIFLSLEKANKIKSTINSVIKTNGEVSENQVDNMKEIRSFCSNLFSGKQVRYS